MSWNARQHVQMDNRGPYYNHNGHNKFNYESSNRQTNLSNSAVRRMLDENENSGKIKEVVWPPPPDDSEIIEAFGNDQLDHNSHQNNHHTLLVKKAQKPFSPPPTYISLRATPPIMQSGPAVYKTQPVATTIRGGARCRGDQRWPPPECKEQMALEEQERMEISRGPMFRPRKVRKDYTTYFAKNAIPNTYPGYKAPPGTQHYPDEMDY